MSLKFESKTELGRDSSKLFNYNWSFRLRAQVFGSNFQTSFFPMSFRTINSKLFNMSFFPTILSNYPFQLHVTPLRSPVCIDNLTVFQQWYRDILKVWKNVSRLSKNAPKQLSIRRSVKDEIKNNEKVAMAHFKISNKKITSLDIWSQLGLIWNGAYIARVFEKK